MKTQNLLFLLAGAAIVYLLLRKQEEAKEQAAAPVVRVVEETLHKHEGEDNPIVHAFEAALEQKAGHEAAPAS